MLPTLPPLPAFPAAISLSATGLSGMDPTGMLAGGLSALSAALSMIPGFSVHLS